jgi:Concanavalin A-like lectin/glucanases superfamily
LLAEKLIAGGGCRGYNAASSDSSLGLSHAAMSRRLCFLLLVASLVPHLANATVLDSLAPFLVDHYTFDKPLDGDPLSTVELDLGSDSTNINLLNGAPRVADGAWWGSSYSLETRQQNAGENDDWKAGIMFGSSAESTLVGTSRVTGITLMGWFKPLGDAADNPSPNTNTENPDDYYNAFGLAGLLRGDSNAGGLDGHAVRALLEVINGKVTGLGRRLDSQSGSGSRASVDDWNIVMPPGKWTHLTAAFDFDLGTIDLYRNGAPLASSATDTGNWNVNGSVNRTSNSSAGGIKIGGSYPDNSQEFNPFNGRVDELMFFNKTLTTQEVAAQFELVSNIDGDFNLDGKVDAADYTTWRDGLDDRFSPADYQVWKANFGTVAPGLGGEGAALDSQNVAEPTGIFPLIFALALQFEQFFLLTRPRRNLLACTRLAS